MTWVLAKCRPRMASNMQCPFVICSLTRSHGNGVFITTTRRGATVYPGAALSYPEKSLSSTNEQSLERRRHGRFPLHSPVRIVYNSEDAMKTHVGQGVDVSASGVAFESDSDLNFYSALRLEYTDDDGENFCRTARLLYRVNRRYAAYFVDGEQV